MNPPLTLDKSLDLNSNFPHFYNNSDKTYGQRSNGQWLNDLKNIFSKKNQTEWIILPLENVICLHPSICIVELISFEWVTHLIGKNEYLLNQHNWIFDVYWWISMYMGLLERERLISYGIALWKEFPYKIFAGELFGGQAVVTVTPIEPFF